MDNQTQSLLPPDSSISMGYFVSTTSILCILILILIIICLFLAKKPPEFNISDYELSNERSSNYSARKSFQYRRSKQQSPSDTSQININEQNKQINLNLLSRK
ncbi:hypothetical protein I4U23_012805 [Adineta vaga]|nr:hypothetical protein I4U23_012805 [Adineta vaga]